jgi:glycosyltransferase involved in cell wall biosynthesis
MKNHHLYFIATGPSGFPGASQIMCRWLLGLTSIGAKVDMVSPRKPFALGGNQCSDVRWVVPNAVHTGAVGQHGAVGPIETLRIAAISEGICALARQATPSEQALVIWGTYLFPYGLAAYLAAQALRHDGINCQLWVTPAGSDIWELGPQFISLARLLLGKPVDKIITYSRIFVDEICASIGINRHFDVVLPPVDSSRFKPGPPDYRHAVRQSLGFVPEAFVISHHSNMRRIKRPEDVLAVAALVAKHLSPCPVHLLMIGPEPPKLQRLPTGPLNVVWTGVKRDVERYLMASDVELNLSAHDSFNLSLAEAMACGVPVVSTSVVGIAPHIQESGGGFIIPLVDTKQRPVQHGGYRDAVSAIVTLARLPEKRAKMAHVAALYAAREFSPQKSTQLLASLALNESATSDGPTSQ